VYLRLRQARGLRNIGGFDSEHQALRTPRCANAYVRADNLPMRLPGTHWSLNRLREDIGHRISAHRQDSELAGVIVALAVGLRDRISAHQRWAMQRTGTAHLMAISGLHIGLVAALGMLLGRSVARTIPRSLLIAPASNWGAVSAFVLALLHAVLAGFAVPTQRALLMLSRS
jgi:competence protein ComEC